MIDHVLPKGAYIDLLEFRKEEYDICTDTFEDCQGGIDYKCILPIGDITITMMPSKTVSDILDQIQEAYANSCKGGLSDFQCYSLIITDIAVNIETREITIEFLR